LFPAPVKAEVEEEESAAAVVPAGLVEGA